MGDLVGGALTSHTELLQMGALSRREQGTAWVRGHSPSSRVQGPHGESQAVSPILGTW